jgi:hypothetical protein
VHKDGRTLEGLHEGGLDGVLHEDSHSTGASDVLGGDGLTCLAGGDNHAAETDGQFERQKGKTYRARMSWRSLLRARTAMHSEATAMSNAVSRVKPFSVPD